VESVGLVLLYRFLNLNSAVFTEMSYLFKLAITPSEISAYFALRRAIFVTEQSLFPESDVDEIDSIARPIIALSQNPSIPILGIVRIYEPEPQLWYGGRLGVHPDHRRVGRIGKGLIHKAVTTANTWGCKKFLATVQLQNVRFFQRLHWSSLEEITVCGLPHHLMEADLSYYPPIADLCPALSQERYYVNRSGQTAAPLDRHSTQAGHPGRLLPTLCRSILL
jgi:putative N-acetyltransferase (TIGR04045 family)